MFSEAPAEVLAASAADNGSASWEGIDPQEAEELRSAGAHLDRDWEELVAVSWKRGAGLTPNEYRQFEESLWRYAVPVLRGMIRTGKIKSLCFEKDIILDMSEDEQRALRLSPEDRDQLVVDSIIWAIEFFRAKVLKPGKWHPDRGASVHTYFIGSCAYGFQASFRKWSGQRSARLSRYGYLLSRDEAWFRLVDTIDPAVVAANGDTLRRIFREAQPEARMICGLIMEGLTQQEIGDRLGMTVRAVEGHMRRLRVTVRRMARRGKIDHTWTSRSDKERAA
ncbi:hypothetical protein [Microtetraspora malaysiensis]|uniref:helix-turn-helix transcriptional regulator n=1 Tax=Microtetraspora malaysiensis TaxID=161358 RepID=UPI003D8C4B11